jgi:flagellar FliJ protein
MSWMESLIRMAELEVETLQKRLKEIADRRESILRSLEQLQQEANAEAAQARKSTEAGWYMAAFSAGVKQRRAKLAADLRATAQEEQGARDALALAFEEQKKYEKLAENARLATAKTLAKRETAELDELALRRAGNW